MSTSESGSGYVTNGQEYKRDQNYLTDRITADGSSGWPVEPDRYRLGVARAGPGAKRAAIFRRLLGPGRGIPMGICGPTHDARRWTFHLGPDRRNPAAGY